MDKLLTLGSRFSSYLNTRRIGVNQAGRDLGLSGAQISNITKGKNFSIKILFKIINKYTDLRLEWLLLGEGDMLRHAPRSEQSAQGTSVASEDSIDYRRDVRKMLDECHQERDQLRVQVATYRDALDRLGRKPESSN